MRDIGSDLRQLINHRENWDFTGANELFAGVDIGTFKTIVVIVDETGKPRAGLLKRTEVVKSGMIVDYAGAQRIVSGMMDQINEVSPFPVGSGATSYPPQTESANINVTRYILEGAGLEVLNVLDEPSAANQVLRINNGAIVDVGGGTTGVAVIKDGEIIYTNDEATGGVHLSLVLAGGLKISYEEAEKLKRDLPRNREIISIVRPVIDKIASIVAGYLQEFDSLSQVCLVGGTCELKGFNEVVRKSLDMETFTPAHPQLITPLGIALSCVK